MTPYNSKRRGHTATFIDNKLYILGGSENGDAGKAFFYIDFSVPFNTQNLIVKDLSNINTVPEHTFATSVKGGANNNTLFLYGGFGPTSMDLVYIYDTIADNWKIRTTSGTIPSGRTGFTAVLGLDGQRVIIYGGYRDGKPVDSSLYELNLINYEWRIPKTSGKTPASRALHRANVIRKYMVISFGKYTYEPPFKLTDMNLTKI
ncbi:hypothetical protein RhiirA4_511849 [Rhizophagus irregularis]|uniref:Attractin/MKLN-like beta-propeller domain-containing protein n=1 Tax=Rhizophagus irregularis TaxID=588596 RepID=A0A2I1HH62_9GLOM|nr:hypothetical protein RhiirA4_511849 [Rhizophagus irregularis]